MELHKGKKCIMQWKKTAIVVWASREIQESFQAAVLKVFVKALSGSWCVSVLNCSRKFLPFCGVCWISTCDSISAAEFSTWKEKFFLIVCGSSRWNLRCLLFLCPFYQIVAKRCSEDIVLFCFPQIFFLPSI